MGIARASKTLPVSRPASICMTEMPVALSPASIARWIGAARQRGKSEAWMFRQPSRGRSSYAIGATAGHRRPPPSSRAPRACSAARGLRIPSKATIESQPAGCGTADRAATPRSRRPKPAVSVRGRRAGPVAQHCVSRGPPRGWPAGLSRRMPACRQTSEPHRGSPCERAPGMSSSGRLRRLMRAGVPAALRACALHLDAGCARASAGSGPDDTLPSK